MDSIDPLAVEVTNEINDKYEKEERSHTTVTWEHEDLAQRSMSVAPGASTQDMDHPPSFDIDIDIGAGWDVTTETDIHRVTASSGISREFSLKEETKQGDIDVQIKVLRGHDDTVRSCQFCDSDSKVLTASNDKTVMLWDFETGTNLQVYEGHSMYVTRARANKMATRFVSSSWDKRVHLWDTETAKILWSGRHMGIATSCNFSHDGRLVVSGSDLDHSVKVWDANSGQIVAESKDIHTSTITSVAFTPHDDRIITTSMDQSTRFWDLQTLKTTITLKGHVNVISAASCSCDERKVATVSWDKSINVWDVSTGMYRSGGAETIEKAHEGNISSCYFAHDGSMLVSGGYDNTVALWDVDNMVQKLRLQGHSDWVEDVGASQNMKWLLSCARDKTVRLWNIEESDRIPVVLENKKSIGLKIFKCMSCGKPFSMAQMENPKDEILCVFCRLQTPERNVPSIDDPDMEDI